MACITIEGFSWKRGYSMFWSNLSLLLFLHAVFLYYLHAKFCALMNKPSRWKFAFNEPHVSNIWCHRQPCCRKMDTSSSQSSSSSPVSSSAVSSPVPGAQKSQHGQKWLRYPEEWVKKKCKYNKDRGGMQLYSLQGWAEKQEAINWHSMSL